MLTVTIHTGGDAFNGGAGAELARILRKLADDLEGAGADWGDTLDGAQLRLYDVNGNHVGAADLTTDDQEGDA